jgi:hypothetical protein
MRLFIGFLLFLLMLAIPAIGPDSPAAVPGNSAPVRDQLPPEKPSVSGASISPLSVPELPSDLSLWVIDFSNNRLFHIDADLGSTFKLLFYASARQAVKLYDIQERGSGLAGYVRELNLPSGYSEGSYLSNSAGRHILLLVNESFASNAVIIDVPAKEVGSLVKSDAFAGADSGYASEGIILIDGTDEGFNSNSPSQSLDTWGYPDYGEILIDSQESGFLSDIPAGEPI